VKRVYQDFQDQGAERDNLVYRDRLELREIEVMIVTVEIPVHQE
jgi:hypothetical protein